MKRNCDSEHFIISLSMTVRGANHRSISSFTLSVYICIIITDISIKAHETFIKLRWFIECGWSVWVFHCLHLPFISVWQTFTHCMPEYCCPMLLITPPLARASNHGTANPKKPNSKTRRHPSRSPPCEMNAMHIVRRAFINCVNTVGHQEFGLGQTNSHMLSAFIR